MNESKPRSRGILLLLAGLGAAAAGCFLPWLTASRLSVTGVELDLVDVFTLGARGSRVTVALVVLAILWVALIGALIAPGRRFTFLGGLVCVVISGAAALRGVTEQSPKLDPGLGLALTFLGGVALIAHGLSRRRAGAPERVPPFLEDLEWLAPPEVSSEAWTPASPEPVPASFSAAEPEPAPVSFSAAEPAPTTRPPAGPPPTTWPPEAWSAPTPDFEPGHRAPRRSLVSLLIVALLFGVAGFAGGQLVKSDEAPRRFSPAPTREFIDDTIGVNLSIPVGWARQDAEGKIRFFDPDSSRDGAAGNAVTGLEVSLDPAESGDLLQIVVDRLSQVPSYEQISVRRVEVSGLAGVRHEYNLNLDGVPSRVIEIFVERSSAGKFARVALFSSLEKSEAEIKRIAATLEVAR